MSRLDKLNDDMHYILNYLLDTIGGLYLEKDSDKKKMLKMIRLINKLKEGDFQKTVYIVKLKSQIDHLNDIINEY